MIDVTRHILLVMCCTLIGYTALWAQDCSESLQGAEEAYKQGRLYDCINLIHSCQTTYQHKSEQQAGYRLLALSYQSLQNEDSADLYLKRLLQVNPDYQGVSAGQDPAEFTRLVQSFRVYPNYLLGIRAGFSLNLPKVVKNNSPFADAVSMYRIVGGYQFGMEGVKTTSGPWNMLARIDLSGSSVRHELNGFNQTNYRFTNRYDQLNLSVGVNRPIIRKPRWTGEISAALGWSTTYRENSILASIDQSDGQTSYIAMEVPSSRSKNQFFGTLGIAWMSPVPNGQLGGYVNLTSFFSATTKKGMAAYDSDQAFKQSYFNDRIRFRSTTIGIKYVIPLRYTAIKSSIQ